LIKNLLFLLFLTASLHITAQFVTVSGTVYDISGRVPLESIAVFSTSGRGTITDSLGRYFFTVKNNDSIWFRANNKNTKKHAVDSMSDRTQFDISLYVRANMLPEVKVYTNSYKVDSLENRKQYNKYFNYTKPGISISAAPMTPTSPGAVGIDINEFINMFRFKRNRNLQFLQNRLLSQEQEKYVDYRFNKKFVSKITKLHSPELDTFIRNYKPDYEFVKNINELELGYYIQQAYKEYKRNKQKSYLRRKDY
jgi:hypothetical protein